MLGLTAKMDCSTAVALSLSSFTLFLVLNHSLRRLPIPSTLAKLEESPRKDYKVWEWHNISVSFVHSCLSGSIAVTCVVAEPALMLDMINNSTYLSNLLVCLSLGYFMYDTIDMMRFRYLTLQLGLHHTVCCLAFGLAVYAGKYIPFAVGALLLEVNSIFLHCRLLLKHSAFGINHICYQVNCVFFFVTHFIFRVVNCLWMIIWEISNKHLIPTFPDFMLGFFGMCVICYENFNLMRTIWQKDVVARLEEEEKES